MSKHKMLTEEEFSRFSPTRRIIDYIECFRKKNGLTRQKMNILDWGCGRGEYTLWLREQGYSAYGIDIDPEPVNNSIDLFISKGYDRSTLSVLHNGTKTIFPDAYFHFTFSNQVFEHVHCMDITAAELARITVRGGCGFHTYPAHRSIYEHHLHMPVVHWLPKNPARKYFIGACVLLKCEPNWPELQNTGFKEKVETYFQYSILKTYYRTYPEIQKFFEKYDFDVTFETLNRTRIRNHAIVGKLIRYRTLKKAINHLLLTFTVQDLVLQKR